MTTERKNEGGEAVNPQRIVLWSVNVEPQWWFIAEKSTRSDINGLPVYETLDPIVGRVGSASIATPSAVEALARAAKEARSGYAWHAGLRPGGTDRLDSEALARIDIALAHPEIAALLKEKE